MTATHAAAVAAVTFHAPNDGLRGMVGGLVEVRRLPLELSEHGLVRLRSFVVLIIPACYNLALNAAFAYN